MYIYRKDTQNSTKKGVKSAGRVVESVVDCTSCRVTSVGTFDSNVSHIAVHFQRENFFASQDFCF